MTPIKRKPASREEMLLNVIQRISTEATNHMIAVTEAIGELRSDIDEKMSEMLVSCAETKERQDRTSEKLENVATEVAAAKNALSQLVNEVVELEKCAAVTKSLEDEKKAWNWKTKWWQSREFFLIVIVIMLIILLANNSGVNIVDDMGRLFKSITGIFVKG